MSIGDRDSEWPWRRAAGRLPGRRASCDAPSVLCLPSRERGDALPGLYLPNRERGDALPGLFLPNRERGDAPCGLDLPSWERGDTLFTLYLPNGERGDTPPDLYLLAILPKLHCFKDACANEREKMYICIASMEAHYRSHTAVSLHNEKS